MLTGQNVVDDYAAIHLELLTNDVAAIRLKLKKNIYDINETAFILERLRALPDEINRFSNTFDLTDEQLILVEQLKDKISSLSEIATSRLKSAKIARNTTTEFQPVSPKASSAHSVELTRWKPAQATVSSLNDELLLSICAFLSFRDLAHCLRVNKFFNQVTPENAPRDGAIFLNKDRTVFLDLLRLTAKLSRPPQLGEILDERKKALQASRFKFWRYTHTKLDSVPDGLQKRIGLAKGPGV